MNQQSAVAQDVPNNSEGERWRTKPRNSALGLKSAGPSRGTREAGNKSHVSLEYDEETGERIQGSQEARSTTGRQTIGIGSSGVSYLEYHLMLWLWMTNLMFPFMTQW